jgi:hypothetical protein
LSAWAVGASDQEGLPAISEEGLHLITDPQLAIVYADPEADLTVYSKVKLLDTYVAFRKNWKRDHNRSTGTFVRDSDIERMRDKLAKEFTEEFTRVLEADDGYPVVDENGPDVLLVRAAIIDLDSTAPDVRTAGRQEIYGYSAGAMTLYIEVYDSQTGDLLAKALDRRADHRSGFMTWQNPATNSQAARRILRGWAQVLRDALDEAHGYSGGGER